MLDFLSWLLPRKTPDYVNLGSHFKRVYKSEERQSLFRVSLFDLSVACSTAEASGSGQSKEHTAKSRVNDRRCCAESHKCQPGSMLHRYIYPLESTSKQGSCPWLERRGDRRNAEWGEEKQWVFHQSFNFLQIG